VTSAFVEQPKALDPRFREDDGLSKYHSSQTAIFLIQHTRRRSHIN
jgi:hypothetical protein